MRALAFVTAALAASILTSAPAAAQNFKPEVIQRSCSDMTFNQIVSGLAELVQKYEFSQDPAEAEQQAISLLCPSAGQAAQAQEAEVREANVVQQAVVAPPPHFNGPKPHFRGPHPRFAPPPRMMPPQVSIPRLPPPPRFAAPRAAPPVVVAGAGYGAGYGAQPRVDHRPRALPLTKSVRGQGYCMAETDPERFVRERPAPHQYCEIGPIPGMPCPGWVCQRR